MIIDESRIIQYVFTTKENYNSLSDDEKTRGTIFFIEDSGEIYKGTDIYTQSVCVVDTLPENPVDTKIYIHDSKIKQYKDSQWETIELIPRIASDIDSAGDEELASASAVKNYIDKLLLNYQEKTNTVFDTMIEAMAFAADSDRSNCGQMITVLINDSYEPFIITQNRELRRIYSQEISVSDTNSVSMMVSSGLILSNVKISSDEGNAVEQKTDGLYVDKNVYIDVIM